MLCFTKKTTKKKKQNRAQIKAQQIKPEKEKTEKNVWLKSPETLGPINFSAKC